MENPLAIEKGNEEKSLNNAHSTLKKKIDCSDNIKACNSSNTKLSNEDEGNTKKMLNINVEIVNNTNSYINKNGISDITEGIDVEEITCELQNVDIGIPSTSGMSKELNSNMKIVKCLKSEIEASDDDEDHSYYETIVSQNFSDVSISRDRPSSLSFKKAKRRVLKISPEEIFSPESPFSDDEKKFESPQTDSQDDVENSIIEILNNPDNASAIPELTVEEERSDLKHWKACTIGGVKRQIDMKVIEPYKRVLSHGGYLTTGSHNAIITFSACFLPHKSRVDYNYVMDNLFFYILYTLNQLVTDDYVLVYLHGGTAKDCIPTYSWLKRCYQMIDRKFKKNLKALYLVHATFWLRTLVTMIKPFISAKFGRKMHFINSLAELYDILPIEEASIPEKVKQYDRIKLSLLYKQK